MKKTIFLGVIFLIGGAFFGKYLYQNSSLAQAVFQQKEAFYFLQEGVYSSSEVMHENVKDLANKLTVKEDNKYYVYLGITKSKENAQKIKKIYDEMGYSTYIKEVNLSNDEFSSNVEQFDILVKESSSTDDVLTIEEVVLANYDEIIGSGL